MRLLLAALLLVVSVGWIYVFSVAMDLISGSEHLRDKR